MAHVQTWWDFLGATPPEPALLMPPIRGEYHGPCGNPVCANEGADWYNHSSFMYYCHACAQHINEQCLAAGTGKVCELHR